MLTLSDDEGLEKLGLFSMKKKNLGVQQHYKKMQYLYLSLPWTAMQHKYSKWKKYCSEGSLVLHKWARAVDSRELTISKLHSMSYTWKQCDFLFDIAGQIPIVPYLSSFWWWLQTSRLITQRVFNYITTAPKLQQFKSVY